MMEIDSKIKIISLVLVVLIISVVVRSFITGMRFISVQQEIREIRSELRCLDREGVELWRK